MAITYPVKFHVDLYERNGNGSFTSEHLDPYEANNLDEVKDIMRQEAQAAIDAGSGEEDWYNWSIRAWIPAEEIDGETVEIYSEDMKTLLEEDE